MEYHVADKKNDGLKPSRSIISEKAKSRDACYLFFFFFKKEDKNMHLYFLEFAQSNSWIHKEVMKVS